MLLLPIVLLAIKSTEAAEGGSNGRAAAAVVLGAFAASLSVL
jgi:hypothetical protein